ncbi:MAG: hypothetical protein ABI615_13225 [Chthoniobacterales bacterium]
MVVSIDPFASEPKQMGLKEWGATWKEWLRSQRAAWKGNSPIFLKEGPVIISGKTESEIRKVAQGEDARLHYIAATRLRDFLKNPVLKAVEPEIKGKPDVAEVHRRYAWMDFPDGKRRNVLLTIFRWDLKKNRTSDTDYAEQVINIEVPGVTPDVAQGQPSAPGHSILALFPFRSQARA